MASAAPTSLGPRAAAPKWWPRYDDGASLACFKGEAQLDGLKEALGVEEAYRYDAWTATSTDFLVYVAAFCQEEGFSATKTARLVSIVASVFAYTFDVGDDDISRRESFEHFKTLVLDATDFELCEIQPIADFVSTTFFRHFNAYRKCFRSKQPVESFQQTLTVDTPLRPPPLATATLRGSDHDHDDDDVME